MPRAARRSADAAELMLDVMVQSPLWDGEPEAKAIIRRALAAAARGSGQEAAEIAVVLTDDAAIRDINRRFRDQDKPTNVLSFPSGAAGRAAAHLGDIVIAYETLAREAQAEGKPFAHHLAHLAIHGYLHLIGYDHTTDAEATRMERMETTLLGALGIPDPYARAEPAV